MTNLPLTTFQRYPTATILGGGAAALGALGCAGALAYSPRDWAFSWLCATVYGLSLALGLLFAVLLHHATDAGWSTIVRRPAEHLLTAMPVLTLLFLPLFLALPLLYDWADPHTAIHLPAGKEKYLNIGFFVARGAFYLLVWTSLAWICRGLSIKQDHTGDPSLSLKLRRRSYLALALFAFTVNFAAVDWLMSLSSAWYSTIFGVYFFAGSAAGGMSLLTLVCVNLARRPLAGKLRESTIHDLGKWTFALCVFWAYIAFSQYFLIWYGNIPEETGWLLARWTGSWKIVSVLFPAGMFAVPFVVLMSADMKHRPRVLAMVCAIVLAGHWLEMQWLALPQARPAGWSPGLWWMDASTLLLVVGLCALAVLRSMARESLWPLHDPRMAEALPPANDPAAPAHS